MFSSQSGTSSSSKSSSLSDTELDLLNRNVEIHRDVPRQLLLYYCFVVEILRVALLRRYLVSVGLTEQNLKFNVCKVNDDTNSYMCILLIHIYIYFFFKWPKNIRNVLHSMFYILNRNVTSVYDRSHDEHDLRATC